MRACTHVERLKSMYACGKTQGSRTREAHVNEIRQLGGVLDLGRHHLGTIAHCRRRFRALLLNLIRHQLESENVCSVASKL